MEQDNKYIRSLIDNAKQGKVVALEELYRMNIDRIFGIIFRMTADKPLACLLTHNVLITAWKNLKDIDENITITDWLRMVAFNLTYHELKSGKLRKDKKKLAPFLTDKDSEKLYSEPLEKAISELKYDARSLIILNRIEEFSFIEIDNLIDIPEEDAKKILVGGMSEIEKSLSNIEPGSGFVNAIEDLPQEIKPDTDIVSYTMDRMREAKEEEFAAIEVEVDEIKKISTGKVKEKKEKKVRKEFKFNKKYVIAILAVVVLSVIVYLLLIQKNIWSVTLESGTVFLNDQAISETQNLFEGDVIKTGESSTAKIGIPNTGNIEIHQQTTIERTGDYNLLKLTSGEILVDTRDGKEKLGIKVPSAVVDEYYLSDYYSLYVDERGNSEIEVYSGWLEVKSGEDISIVPEGFKINVLNEASVGIPYLSGSDPSFIQLLEDYLFGGENPAVLNTILTHTSNKDVITLWNLLHRVKPNQRSDVYEILVGFVPLPEGATRNEVLTLDPNALQLWLNDIEWQM